MDAATQRPHIVGRPSIVPNDFVTRIDLPAFYTDQMKTDIIASRRLLNLALLDGLNLANRGFNVTRNDDRIAHAECSSINNARRDHGIDRRSNVEDIMHGELRLLWHRLRSHVG
ncbi:MAG: hypothetical protein ISR77_32280 [Pirellulaceae bacterium]|nr:hypothetical protein [Pirellulaceae bacterium]